jgi:L-aspartate oxidase
MRAEVREARTRKKEDRPRPAASKPGVDAPADEVIAEIQDLMWQNAGIVRERAGLVRAIERLQQIRPRVAHPQARRAWEAQNLCEAGLLVARSALAREESRGAHYRTDFPAHDDAKFLRHSRLQVEAIRFV